MAEVSAWIYELFYTTAAEEEQFHLFFYFLFLFYFYFFTFGKRLLWLEAEPRFWLWLGDGEHIVHWYFPGMGENIQRWSKGKINKYSSNQVKQNET